MQKYTVSELTSLWCFILLLTAILGPWAPRAQSSLIIHDHQWSLIIHDHWSSIIIHHHHFSDFSIFFKFSKFDRKLSKSMKIPSNISKIDFFGKIEISKFDRNQMYRLKSINNKLKSIKNRYQMIKFSIKLLAVRPFRLKIGSDSSKLHHGSF